MSSKQICAFLKHRDVLQFENFYDNHPATYIPFVVYNHLIVSLLPSLYAEESTALENSRIIMLQEQKLGLKILEIFINMTLNINIYLSEEIFDKNVNILKSTTDLTRDVVFPLLFAEGYMSEENAESYKKALTSFFPNNVVTNSEDLIPCANFFEDIQGTLVGTQIWGPPMWTVLHYTSLVIDQQSEFNKNKEYLASLSGIFDLFLPCGICRYHYKSNQQHENEPFPRPFPITLPYLALYYAKRQKLFDFYSILHQCCKPVSTNSREPLSVDFYKRHYLNFYKNQN